MAKHWKFIEFGIGEDSKYLPEAVASGFFVFSETEDKVFIERMSVESSEDIDVEQFIIHFWEGHSPGKQVAISDKADVWTNEDIEDISYFQYNGETRALIKPEDLEIKSLKDFLEITGLSRNPLPTNKLLKDLFVLLRIKDEDLMANIYGYFLTDATEGISFFKINGFWKDSKVKFSDYLVTDSEEVIDDNDDSIFFYGLDEKAIQEAIQLKWNTAHDFVITSYSKVIQ